MPDSEAVLHERILTLEDMLRREQARVTQAEQRAKAMEGALRRAYEFQLAGKKQPRGDGDPR